MPTQWLQLLRVQAKDKEAGACLVTVEASSTESAMAGQTVRLPQGQNLPSLANLKPLPADTQVRRAIVVGSVGGCTITAYIMPGRSTERSPLSATPPPPGDPAVQAADVFRAWARGVKNGELEPFSAVVSPSEWNGMDAAQRTRRLQEYQESFKTVLGEGYNPDEFKIEYTASPSVGSGKLKVRYGDKELPELRIHYLGGRWVLSEP